MSSAKDTVPHAEESKDSAYTPQRAIERFTVGPASRAFFEASYGETPEAWAAKQGDEFGEFTLMKSMMSRILSNQMGDPQELEKLGEAARAEWAALGFDDSKNISILRASDRIASGQRQHFTEETLQGMMDSSTPTKDLLGMLATEAGVSLSEADLKKSTQGLADVMKMLVDASNEEDEGPHAEEPFNVDDFRGELFGGKPSAATSGSSAAKPSESVGGDFASIVMEAVMKQLQLAANSFTGENDPVIKDRKIEEVSDSDDEAET